MPITPLHFGLLTPINHFAPNRVSNFSFILANLWMDLTFIQYWFFNLPLPEHTPDSHSFYGAAVSGVVISVLGMRLHRPWPLLPTTAWVYGAFAGSFTHILLDTLVHPEMKPFYPAADNNPFYMGWMEPLSWIMLPLLVWLTAQYVSGILARIAKAWAGPVFIEDIAMLARAVKLNSRALEALKEDAKRPASNVKVNG